jgi:hypothetical protein
MFPRSRCMVEQVATLLNGGDPFAGPPWRNETSRAPRASFPRRQDGEYGRTIPLADTRSDHGTRICHPETGTSSQLTETVGGPIATKGTGRAPVSIRMVEPEIVYRFRTSLRPLFVRSAHCRSRAGPRARRGRISRPGGALRL